jgi:hypothetical protein
MSLNLMTELGNANRIHKNFIFLGKESSPAFMRLWRTANSTPGSGKQNGLRPRRDGEQGNGIKLEGYGLKYS